MTSDSKTARAGLGDLSREELLDLVERLGQESHGAAQRIQYLLAPRAAARDIAQRIAALARSDYRHGRGLAEILGDELGGIVADIERDVLPENPVGALALIEALLDLDGPLMQFEMDYSSMSQAFEDASLLWLKAARAVRDCGALPLMDWLARLREIYAREDYGAREFLVEEARQLLDDSQCQQLNDQRALEGRDRHEREHRRGRLLSGDLSLASRSSPPEEMPPGPRTPTMVLEQARLHLDCGEFEQALSILLPLRDGQTFCDPHSTLDLLDRAYGQIGDTAKRIGVRRERFFAKPDLKNYRRLTQLLDLPALEALRTEIATKSLTTTDVVTRARVLFAVDLPLLAQSLVLASASTFEIEGPTYRIAHLGTEATEHGYPLVASVIWRGVVNSILKSGKTRDYRIGQRLLEELQDLAAEIDDYREFPSHLEYETELYNRHCLKKQFWRGIERMRPD